MKTLTLSVPEKVGENQFWLLRGQLDNLVKQNFDLLYEGAVRLGFNIEADYYAPQRVQINNTRLHTSQHLKYADGHKYDYDNAPTASQIENTVNDLQTLLNAASENISAPFTIEIKQK
jgi:hypothetical protein